MTPLKIKFVTTFRTTLETLMVDKVIARNTRQ